MSQKQLWLTSFTIIAALLIGTALTSCDHRKHYEYKESKWLYSYYDSRRDDKEHSTGDDGWELVCVDQSGYYVFKREK